MTVNNGVNNSTINKRIKILMAYKRIIDTKGNISLGKLLSKRLPLYIGLGILFLGGLFVACWPPGQPMLGGVMGGIAAGAFVADVSFVAAAQRVLAFNYKFIDVEAVETALTELKQVSTSGKATKIGLKLWLSYLVFFVLLIVVFILLFLN